MKYWVSEEVADDVLGYARGYLIADPHGTRRGVISQYNTSLYLESPQLSCYRAHVDEAPDRFKLRVRAYGDPPQGLAFFETKRKVNSVIIKTRAAVTMDRMAPLLEGDHDALTEASGTPERRHLESFLYLQTITHARPFVLVRACREAYCSTDPHEDVRLTIDRRIAFQQARGPGFEADSNDWVPIDGEEEHGRDVGPVMLELKFPGAPPLWMAALVRRLEMCRIAYSKYVAAARSLIEGDNLDRSLWSAIARGDG
jgi:hypothetical protein